MENFGGDMEVKRLDLTSSGQVDLTAATLHCTITVPCLRMRQRPSARTLQYVTVPICNIYHCFSGNGSLRIEQ